MGFEELLQAIQGSTKRKVERHLNSCYPKTMTRVEMLAKALNGVVVEDHGYRGIIHVPERNEYVRFHSVHGVHVVMRNPKTWRVTRSLLAADEVTPFLEEAGVLPKSTPLERPIDAIARLIGGTLFMTFQTGGGVIKYGSGKFLRFSNITGLDIVEYVVSKWRSVCHVMDRNDTLRHLMEDQDGLVEKLREYGAHAPEERTVANG